MSSKSIFHKFRFTFWLGSAYFKKHALFISLGLLIGIVVGLKAKDIIPMLFPNLEEHRIGIIGNYTQKNLPFEIQGLISYGLTTYDEKYDVIPKIIDKFEVLNKGKTYIFYLKKNLFWHDGTKFTSKDVNYQFKDVTTKLENDYKIKFELSEVFAPFPSLVTQPLFKKGLIGLGEYKLKELDIEGKFINKIVLQNNQKKLIIKFYPREEEAIKGYKLGEVDEIKGIEDTSSLKDWKNTKIVSNIEETKYLALFLNTRKGIFQEKSFRQALNYAIDGDKFKGKRAYSPIPDNSWAYNPNVKTYEYNLDTAQNLLAKTNESSSSVKIKLTVLRPYEKYSKVIVDSWKKLGLDVKLETVALPPANFDVLLAAQEITRDPDQYFLWHSTGKMNITGYNSPRIDKLLEDARKTVDQKDRKEKYFDFQRFLAEDSPAIFLFYPPSYTVSRI